MKRFTYHIRCQKPTGGRWLVVVMATDRDQARRQVEAELPEGHSVVRVQKAPSRFRQFPR
jgi:hypothetical protein